MASKSDVVWAIDIGSNSLKALHLSTAGGIVEVIGFENIQHSKILTGSGVKAAERDELIALSLRQFVSQNDLSRDDVVISVPGQNSFARFVNLPPVEQKRIPEIVKFEAAQQIPFDINDVQWDWQMMTKPGSSEAKVGIFAVKSEVVSSMLEHFSRENLRISWVQIAPMALYNYLLYDRPELVKSDDQATVIINIGAENTDLVVCTKSTVWQRCIQMGGNAFTRAVAETFKLNFEKAEKLKRTAPMSKYARQILQAMKPVFTDLASEIQRSLGFYNSSNPNTKLARIIALGGGTKMRGLLKYLQQSLQIPIERPDSFKKLEISSGVSAAKFHENVCDFGVVYGLALQGLGEAKIENNLLPDSVARSMAWAGKARYFIGAAIVLLAVSFMCLGRTIFDRVSYNSKANKRQQIKNVIRTGEQAISRLETEKKKGRGFGEMIQKEFKPFEYRSVVPLLYQTVISALPNERNNPEQKELYDAFGDGDVEAVLKTPRNQRKQIFVTNMSIYFTNYLENAEFSGADLEGGRGAKKIVENYDEDYYGVSGFDTFGAPGEEGEESAAGFVVTVSGYSPYKDIGELIDPAGVKDDKSKWGFVTRLLHLEEIVDGNSPFELYKKTELDHFKLKIGKVSLKAKMPMGVGVHDIRYASAEQESLRGGAVGKEFLIDPMTREVINEVAVLSKDGRQKIDRVGNVVRQINDHWFILNFKFIWKDAPKRD